MYRTTYALYKERKAYNAALAEYDALPTIKRIFSKAPKCPTEKSTGELVTAMVREFNEAYNLGTRRDLPNGDSIHCCLGWQSEGRPVLSITMYHCNCVMQSRMAQQSDLTWKEWGIQYPYSECGLTLTPQNADEVLRSEEMRQAYWRFGKILAQCKEVFN